MAKGWTEERRKAQAERCRANKPWENSTGPKTPEGKARASMNAFKHGGDRGMKDVCAAMLRHNHEFVKLALLFHQNELKKALQKQGAYPPPLAKFRKTE